MRAKIYPSLFNAYNICPRQAWLMSRQMTADQDNEFLDMGRLIDETTFEREKKKIYIADIGAIIDMVIKKDGSFMIAEIKKSSKTLKTGIVQLKYYLFLLKQKGLTTKGIIKIPKENKSIEIELTEEDIVKIQNTLKNIKKLLSNNTIPKAKELKICPKCGHFEFCWS